ncbi:zf-HC2 domain-containing protein [Jeotgalibacillus sp. ET6]|uniref:zf-HC2 domain-containing protein n=1 Tax=Jeotgalibacillus sp. ET6 TaxID=3037260 RepID=UPI002418BB1B|nr:zf-HC2 domain-containing protein [Jeotgalibacillus sp. ET6]MDG5472484.1 zf-HC2 domain-containing protein [Jeotgalibacillus sp. ET6]
MNEVKCTIIQDVLPLYVDEVVSEDTKEMVEQHLHQCENCRQEYRSMKQALRIPAKNKGSALGKIKKRWRKKKWMISMASILATMALLFGIFSYIFYFKTVIPYSQELITIENQDNELVSRYSGNSYAGVHATHPMTVEVDGTEKNVIVMFYTQTLYDSPSGSFINPKENPNVQGSTFQLPEGQTADAVYYAEFDAEEISFEKDAWSDIIERATLIWER